MLIKVFLILSALGLFFGCAQKLQQKNVEPFVEETTFGEANLEIGASLYKRCYICHSLKPGVQLSGPSLGNIWGKPSGQVKGYRFYTDVIKQKGLTWDESSLLAWIENPEYVIPGTAMKFKGYIQKKSIERLVEFLKIATGPDGYQRVIDMKLLTPEYAYGRLTDLKKTTDSMIVTNIEHCNETFTVTTKDRSKISYWEMNLDFKVSSGEMGPLRNEPTIIPSHSQRDRFSVVFRDPTEIKAIIKKCKKSLHQ